MQKVQRAVVPFILAALCAGCSTAVSDIQKACENSQVCSGDPVQPCVTQSSGIQSRLAAASVCKDVLAAYNTLIHCSATTACTVMNPCTTEQQALNSALSAASQSTSTCTNALTGTTGGDT